MSPERLCAIAHDYNDYNVHSRKEQAEGEGTALLFTLSVVVPLPFPGASDHRVSLILECLVKTIGSIAQAFQMLHKIVCPFHGHQETVATVC